jgi:hypothetical protein
VVASRAIVLPSAIASVEPLFEGISWGILHEWEYELRLCSAPLDLRVGSP